MNVKIVNEQQIKMDENSTAKTSRTYTWDFEGMDDKGVASLAVRDLVIKVAGLHRHGKPIPKSGATIKVIDLVRGRPLMTPAETVAAAIPNMTDEERAAAIVALGGTV